MYGDENPGDPSSVTLILAWMRSVGEELLSDTLALVELVYIICASTMVFHPLTVNL